MRRIVIAAAAVGAVVLAVLSLSPRAGAQTPSPGFMTVDAVEFFGSYPVAVTGVVVGEAAPSTHYASFSYNDDLRALRVEACHRALLLALAKPGQYLARVGQNVCTVALAAP